MKVWELAMALDDADGDDEVVIVGEFGQLHLTREARWCPPVESWQAPEPEADYEGRLFIWCRKVRKYPVMTEAEKEGVGL